MEYRFSERRQFVRLNLINLRIPKIATRPFLEFRDESILHCVLTPPTDVGKLKDVSLEKYAGDINPIGSYLLKQREAEGRELPDGCIFDFFNHGVYV